MACGRHHAVSSCESPSSTSVFSTHREKARAIKPPPGREGGETRAEALQTPLFAVGVAPREPEVLRHRWITDLPGSHRGPLPSFPLARSSSSPVG